MNAKTKAKKWIRNLTTNPNSLTKPRNQLFLNS